MAYVKIEYEARFTNVDFDVIRRELRSLQAQRLFPRTLLKRVVFESDSLRETRSWLRLRSTGSGGTTLTLKQAGGAVSSVESIKELEIGVSDFADGQALLEKLGFRAVRYQENYREEWTFDGIVYDLDEWPGLPPFIEIEGTDAESVRLGAKRLGLDFEKATFGSVDELYLSLHHRDILTESRLTFN